jgi:integrase/recombinase XerD
LLPATISQEKEPNAMKFSEAIKGYLYDFVADGYSQQTAYLYKTLLPKVAKFLGDPEIDQVTPDDLQRFIMYLRTDYTPRRLNDKTGPLSEYAVANYKKAIRSFFRWCEETFDIPRPVRKLKLKQFDEPVQIPFTQQEVKSLLKACEFSADANVSDKQPYHMRRPTADRDRALVLLLLDTGMRVGEVERLDVQSINIDTGQVIVATFGRGIKSKSRTVYLGKSAKRAMWVYLAKHKAGAKPTEKVFEMCSDTIRSLLRGLGMRAGVSDVHPHKFRHTFAITYLRNGGNVIFLKQLLGHTRLQMSEKYLAVAQADLEQAHRDNSPADNWKL